MSNRSLGTKSTNTAITLNNIKRTQTDTLPFRIEFIKTLLEGKDVQPMVDFENTETEYFTGKVNIKNEDSDDGNNDKNNDTRLLLKKKLFDFNKVINQIGGKLLYIKSGTTGHTFKGTINAEENEFNYAVKVVAYPKKEKYGSINDARRPENAELMMIKLLSYFVVKKQTPHIVLPIGTFNANIKQFVKLAKDGYIDEDNKRYGEFVERYEKNEYHDEVSILISEWANRGDLLDFIKSNYTKFKPIFWKTIFFQIISTLAVIQSKYPSFRHNDLKANNILIHKVEKDWKKFTYTVVKKTYIVPNIYYQIKFWDFDFACIPGIVNNSKVESEWTKQINVTPEKNRYYDMHYFFNTLIKKGFFPQLMTDECVPQEVKDFVNRVVPKKYQTGTDVHKRGRILTNLEYLTPDEVLSKDPYFEEFRVQKVKKQENANEAIDKTTKENNIKNIEKNTDVVEDIQKIIGGKSNRNNKIKKSRKSSKNNDKKKKRQSISEINLDDILLEKD